MKYIKIIGLTVISFLLLSLGLKSSKLNKKAMKQKALAWKAIYEKRVDKFQDIIETVKAEITVLYNIEDPHNSAIKKLESEKKLLYNKVIKLKTQMNTVVTEIMTLDEALKYDVKI